MTESEWLASEDPHDMLGFLTMRPQQAAAINRRRVSDRQLRLFAAACCRQTWAALTAQEREAVLAGERLADGEEWTDAVRDLADRTNTGCLTGDATAGAWRAIFFAGKTQRVTLLRDIVGNPFSPVRLPLVPDGPVDAIAAGLVQGALLRRIAPASYEKVRMHCPWLMPDVLSLAWAAYEERQADGTLDPLRLSVLADALEDAGCPVGIDVLCQRCGPHRAEADRLGLGPGHHPERDPASGRHEGGWTNCKTCKGAPVRAMNPLLAHLRGWAQTHAGTYFLSTAHPLTHVRGCWAVDLLLGKS